MNHSAEKINLYYFNSTSNSILLWKKKLDGNIVCLKQRLILQTISFQTDKVRQVERSYDLEQFSTQLFLQTIYKKFLILYCKTHLDFSDYCTERTFLINFNNQKFHIFPKKAINRCSFCPQKHLRSKK